MPHDELGLVLRVATLLAIPLAFVVLIPSLFGFWLFNREAKIRSSQHRALIVEFREADLAGQDLLAEFVCTSIRIRRGSSDPTEDALAEEFTRLLGVIGRTCD